MVWIKERRERGEGQKTRRWGGRGGLGKVVVARKRRIFLIGTRRPSVSTNFSSSGKKGGKRVARNEEKKRRGERKDRNRYDATVVRIHSGVY